MTLPVAVLHGFTGSPHSFDGVVSRLGARVVSAPPLVGHGAPNKSPESTSFEQEVDRLAALFRAEAPRWHLAGYSLGGRVALGLLVRHPTLFASATLVGAQPGLRTETERAERREADERLCRVLEERGVAAFVDEWQALPLFATQSALAPDVLERQRAERLAHDPLELARSLRVTGLGVMPSYWDVLSRIAIPVTLVVGERDAKFSALAAEMSRHLAHACVESVAGAGHNVVLERPDIVSRCIAQHPGDGR